MIRLVALAVGCLALADAPPAPSNYDQMKAAAGRDAASQVQLALWCEANGLETERLRHLAVAVLSDPSNAMARGLMGLVEYGGKWKRPEAVADALKADVKHADLMAEYSGRRVRTPVKPDAQWKLALWCEEKGLKDEARAHLATVVRLDPNHADAWKKLGYRKVGNRWLTDAQADREKTERQAQQEADRRWRPRLEHLREALDGRGQRRDDAQRELATITDPRAVPAVWHAFVERGGNHQVEAVQLLGQIDAIEASRALATLAVGSKFAEVRRRATETLRRRDPREWADPLIGMLQEKIKYEVKKVGGPGSTGVLYVEGKEANVKRLYSAPNMPVLALQPGQSLSTDANGLPVIVNHQFILPPENVQNGLNRSQAESLVASYSSFVSPTLASLPGIPKEASNVFQKMNAQTSSGLEQQMLGQLAQWPANTPRSARTVNAHFNSEIDLQTVIPIGQMMVESQRAAVSAQKQLEQDVAAIESRNETIGARNDRLVRVLAEATGQSLPAAPKPWRDWFINQLGYRNDLMTDDPKPTIIEDVPLAYTPQSAPIQQAVTIKTSLFFRRLSCFGAGTTVQTILGTRPIENLNVGDLVLTQDTNTGKLGYRPITVVHHNPPSPTFEVSLGGNAIVSSHFHRFWVAGRGWVMARDLKEGDPIRTLGGVAKVTKIETGEVQPVFNLDVEGDADFFVGDAAALVHDNTLPDLKQVPFDAPPAVAAK
ncbi:MAG TPA: Hint domain-containing protein [Isosphaeraceae bacterium]